MLESLRNAAGGWIAKILIACLALSFAIWGVADIFSGAGQPILASVGDVDISPDDFLKSFKGEMRVLEKRNGRPVRISKDQTLRMGARVLDQLIARATIDNDAMVRKLGIDDNIIAASILDNPLFHDSFGNFSRDDFLRTLRDNGLSEEDYTIAERKAFKRRQIIATVSAGVVVPESLIEAAFRFNEERRKLAYMTVTPNMIEPIGALDDDQLKAFFDMRKEQFRAPQYRDIEWLTVSVRIDEQDLRAEYEARKTSFQRNERRQVEQIMFANEEDARAAHEKIRAGASFSDIMRQEGLRETDINLGLLEKKEFLDSKIGEMAFALPLDTISAPIQSQFGAAILRVTRIEPATIPDFKDKVDILRAELTARAIQGKTIDLYEQIEDERAAGATFSEIAEKLSLSHRVIQHIDARGRNLDGQTIEAIPARGELINLAFQIDPGTETEPIPLDNGGFVWLNVRGVTPARDRALEEVRKEVENLWRDEEQRRRLGALASDIVDRLKAGEDFDRIAKKFATKIVLTPPLKRTSTSQDISRAALDNAFITPVNDFVFSESANGTDRLVLQIREVDLPPLVPDSQTSQAISAYFTRDISEGNLTRYIASRRKKFGTTIDRNAQAKLFRGL